MNGWGTFREHVTSWSESLCFRTSYLHQNTHMGRQSGDTCARSLPLGTHAGVYKFTGLTQERNLQTVAHSITNIAGSVQKQQCEVLEQIH